MPLHPEKTSGSREPTVTGTAAADDLLLMAAALSWAAALIHAVVTPAHFREWWLFGVFFVVVAAFQLVWGARAYPRPRPWLLRAGALVNVAVASVWVVSRTIGVPLGPEPWEREGIGFVDVMATLDELLIAALAWAVLSGWRPPRAPAWAIFYPLAVLSVLGAMLGGGHHH